MSDDVSVLRLANDQLLAALEVVLAGLDAAQLQYQAPLLDERQRALHGRLPFILS